MIETSPGLIEKSQCGKFSFWQFHRLPSFQLWLPSFQFHVNLPTTRTCSSCLRNRMMKRWYKTIQLLPFFRMHCSHALTSQTFQSQASISMKWCPPPPPPLPPPHHSLQILPGKPPSGGDTEVNTSYRTVPPPRRVPWCGKQIGLRTNVWHRPGKYFASPGNYTTCVLYISKTGFTPIARHSCSNPHKTFSPVFFGSFSLSAAENCQRHNCEWSGKVHFQHSSPRMR